MIEELLEYPEDFLCFSCICYEIWSVVSESVYGIFNPQKRERGKIDQDTDILAWLYVRI